jgi:SAM-dependent methyltransferase
MPEHYTPGYSRNATAFMAQRTVDTHAAFFKPYLKPGMTLLDCGCGPGTITQGLANLIAPGTVIGIDKEPSQLQLAQQTAPAQTVSSIQFVQASIYSLPFADQSFDAVFAHAVLEHLQEPVKALQECWRVLKPGGWIGVRSPDLGGFLIAPEHPDLDEAIAYYKCCQRQNGGNLNIGRQLRALLREAGFSAIQATATYKCYAPLSLIADYLALRIEASATIDRAIEQNWTDAPTIARMSQALRNWSQHPDGFFAQAWCEAVGQKL